MMAISGSDDGTVKLWDLEHGCELRTLIGHLNSVNAVACFPDGYRVVSGSRDGILKIWDTRNGDELETLKGHVESIDSIIIAKNGTLMISASSDAIKIWDIDIDHVNVLKTIKNGTNRTTAIALFSDEQRIISASNDKSLNIWDLNSGENSYIYHGSHFEE